MDIDRLKKLLENPLVASLIKSGGVAKAIDDVADDRLGDGSGEIHPFYAWRPRPKLEYQHHLMRCDAAVMALIAGNQVGKTMSGARFVAAHMMGVEPLYPERRYKVPIKVWVLTKGPLMEALMDEVLAMIPPSEVNLRSIKRSAGRCRFKLKNGSVLEMRSFDQSVDTLKQAKCDIVWIDEVLNTKNANDVLIELFVRLLKRGGRMIFTMTPDRRGGSILKRKILAMGYNDPTKKNALSGPFAWFTADMRDNDTLDPISVEKLIREIGADEELFNIKIRGMWPDTDGSNVFPSHAVAEQRKNVSAPARWVDFDDAGAIYDRPAETGFGIWEEPIPATGYAIGVDLSEGGEKSDYSVVYVGKVANNQIVARFRGRVAPDILARRVAMLGRWYNTAIIANEMNGRSAGAFISTIRNARGSYPSLYRREAHGWNRNMMLKTFGWETDGFNKPRMVNEARHILVNHMTYIPCVHLLNEMENFQELRDVDSDNNGFGAVEGHDDCVMAYMIFLQATKQGTAFYNTSMQDVYQFRDPKVGYAVKLVRDHLKKQKRESKNAAIEEWY